MSNPGPHLKKAMESHVIFTLALPLWWIQLFGRERGKRRKFGQILIRMKVSPRNPDTERLICVNTGLIGSVVVYDADRVADSSLI